MLNNQSNYFLIYINNINLPPSNKNKMFKTSTILNINIIKNYTMLIKFIYNIEYCFL